MTEEWRQAIRSGSADEEDAFLRSKHERAQRPELAERRPAAVRAIGEDGRLPGLAAVLSVVLVLVRIVRVLGGDAPELIRRARVEVERHEHLADGDPRTAG